jgi:hypothetical protein
MSQKKMFNSKKNINIHVFTPNYLPTYLPQPTYLNIDLNLFWTNSIYMPHGTFYGTKHHN